MNLGAFVGLLCGILILALSTVLAAAFHMDRMVGLINLSSVLIVLGGTLSVTLIAKPFHTVAQAVCAFGFVFQSRTDSMGVENAIDTIRELSQIARREGMIALEDAIQRISAQDRFLRRGIMLIVDGIEPTRVREILENELVYVSDRHKQIQDVWLFIGAQAPQWGFVGSFLGIIMMLQESSDPYLLGTKVAYALVSILYGALLAQLIAIPVATRLESMSKSEIVVKQVIIEGLVSIQSGESTATVEERMKSFLSAKVRIKRRGRGNE